MLKSGRVLSSTYRIERSLGPSSLGPTYLGTVGDSEQHVCICEVSSLSPAALQRLYAFQVSIASRSHTALPSTTAVFEDHGRPYCVEDFISGCTLQDLRIHLGKPHPVEALRWALELCDVLAWMQDNEVRLDPSRMTLSNLVLDEEGHIRLHGLFQMAASDAPIQSKGWTGILGSLLAPPDAREAALFDRSEEVQRLLPGLVALTSRLKSGYQGTLEAVREEICSIRKADPIVIPNQPVLDERYVVVPFETPHSLAGYAEHSVRMEQTLGAVGQEPSVAPKRFPMVRTALFVLLSVVLLFCGTILAEVASTPDVGNPPLRHHAQVSRSVTPGVRAQIVSRTRLLLRALGDQMHKMAGPPDSSVAPTDVAHPAM